MPKQKVGDGRPSTPKQAAASRVNGSKSKGPKTVTGKSKVAQNATRDGLFSRQVVIDQLGEKQADFEAITQRIWDVLQPTNALEEMLVRDFIENWWKRERIRRVETGVLRTKAGFLGLRMMLGNEDRLEKLRFSFLLLYGEYVKVIGCPAATKANEIMVELEEVRQQLIATSQGVGFLLEEIERLSREMKIMGTLSGEDEMRLQACCGFGHHAATLFVEINKLNQKQTQEPIQKDTRYPWSADNSPSKDLRTEILLAFWKAREEQKRKATGPADTPQPNVPDKPKIQEGENTEANGKTKAQKEEEKKREERSELLAQLIRTAEDTCAEENSYLRPSNGRRPRQLSP